MKPSVLLFLLIATVLEVTGDAIIRKSLFAHAGLARIGLFAVGAALLDGELAYHQGKHEEAYAHLRQAVELDDNLTYDKDLKQVLFGGDGKPGVPFQGSYSSGAVYSYTETGTFHPYVELTDEDGHTTTIYPHAFASPSITL